MPTVHLLTYRHKAGQSKYWRYRILGAALLPTDCSQLQVAGGRTSLLLQLSPTHVFPASPSSPSPLQVQWLCCEKQIGRTETEATSKSGHMELKSARRTHTFTAVYMDMQTHTVTLFSSVPITLCRVLRLIPVRARNINAKRESLLKWPSAAFNFLLRAWGCLNV